MTYYFRNNSQKKNKKLEHIQNLEVKILSLELENLNKDFKLLEEYNLNVVFEKLQLAKLNEENLQIAFLENRDDDDSYDKFKTYTDCINLLHNSISKTKELKSQIYELIKRKKVVLNGNEVQNLSSLILNTKTDMEDACSKFDSLYHNINSHIK